LRRPFEDQAGIGLRKLLVHSALVDRTCALCRGTLGKLASAALVDPGDGTFAIA
jgi:hypothetical protein